MMAQRLRRRRDGLGPDELQDVVERGLADAEVGGRVSEGEAREVDREESGRRADDLIVLHESLVANRVTHRASHAHGVPGALDLDPWVRPPDERGEQAVLRGRATLPHTRDEIVVRRVTERAELLDAAHLVAA